MSRLSQRPENTVLDGNERVDHTDTSDTSQSADGTSKWFGLAALLSWLSPNFEASGNVATHNADAAAHAGINAGTADGDLIPFDGTSYYKLGIGLDGQILTARPGAGPQVKLVWEAPAGGGGGDVTGPASAVDGNLASYNGTTGKIIADSAIPAAQVPRLDAENNFSGAGERYQEFTSTDNVVGLQFQPGNGTVDQRRFRFVAGSGSMNLQAITDAGAFTRTVLDWQHDGDVNVASGVLTEQNVKIQYPAPIIVASGTHNPNFDSPSAPFIHFTGTATVGPITGTSNGAIMVTVDPAAVLTIDPSYDVRGSRTAGKGICAVILRDGNGTYWHWGSEQP